MWVRGRLYSLYIPLIYACDDLFKRVQNLHMNFTMIYSGHFCTDSTTSFGHYDTLYLAVIILFIIINLI